MDVSIERLNHANKPQVSLRELRRMVEGMLDIIENPDSVHNDRKRACGTIRDILAAHDEGQFAINLAAHEYNEAANDSAADHRATHLDSQEAAFAEKLRDLMRARAMTQAELASRVGCSQPAISQMLKRQCRPQKTTILKLASALGVDARHLWTDLDVAEILDTVAAIQEEETMSEAEAEAARRALQRPVSDASAAPLPKRKR